MTKPLSEIARQAWLDCPLDGDHWGAAANAVIDECARKLCCYCAAGHEVRFDPEYGDWIHNSPHISGEAVECDANAILSLKSGNDREAE